MNSVQQDFKIDVCKRMCGMKCISWSAIVAGAFVAIGLSSLLNFFSTAIGLSIYRVTDGVSKLAVGGMLGFAIGIIATMFFAGWVAGYFGRSHCHKKYCGALHGFTAWCLALILMVILALPFSHFIAEYTNYLANVTAIHSTAMPEVTAASVIAHESLGDLSKGAFVLFLMFFLGAIASTCGGHIGVMSCQKDECCTSCKCNKCNK